MDPTPTPNPVPEGVATLSVEQILDIERRFRENKAATLRGDPPPHTVTPEELRAAIQSMRAHRGTMNLVAPSAKGNGKRAGGKPNIEIIDLEGL